MFSYIITVYNEKTTIACVLNFRNENDVVTKTNYRRFPWQFVSELLDAAVWLLLPQNIELDTLFKDNKCYKE